MTHLTKFLAASISSLFISSAMAGGYVSASLGQTDHDIDGFDKGTSFAVSGGYKFTPNFAVEVSYVDLGDSKDDIDPVWTIEADGFNLAAVGILPVNETIDVFAKVGIFMWDISLDEAGWGEIGSDDGTDLSVGIGASAKLTEEFSIQFEFQRFDIDGEDSDNISLGARFNF